MTQQDPTPIGDEGFRCPHRYGCWQREAVRLLLACVVSLVIGCTLKVRAPGISVDSEPSWPDKHAAATPSDMPALPAITINMPASPAPPTSRPAAK